MIWFLVSMWVFGDQHQVPLLQNKAMDKLLAEIARTKTVFLDVVPELYAKTPAGSPLRKVFMEIIGWTVDLRDWRSFNGIADWTVECLTDLMLAANEARFSKEVTFASQPKRDKCFFHVHARDEHC